MRRLLVEKEEGKLSSEQNNLITLWQAVMKKWWRNLVCASTDGGVRSTDQVWVRAPQYHLSYYEGWCTHDRLKVTHVMRLSDCQIPDFLSNKPPVKRKHACLDSILVNVTSVHNILKLFSMFLFHHFSKFLLLCLSRLTKSSALILWPSARLEGN